MSAEAVTTAVSGDVEPKHKQPQPLDDVMLAMDVVDTLRRRRRLVERELDAEGREQDLKQRLHKIYATQGIEVPDHVLEEGVAALKEERFVYSPPPESLATRLASLYVRRASWGKWVMASLAGLLVTWLVSRHRRRELEDRIRSQEELADSIFNSSRESLQSLEEMAERAGGIFSTTTGNPSPQINSTAEIPNTLRR